MTSCTATSSPAVIESELEASWKIPVAPAAIDTDCPPLLALTLVLTVVADVAIVLALITTVNIDSVPAV